MTAYTVLLFGITKDLIGKKSIQLEIEGNLTAKKCLETLKERYPSLANLPSMRLAAEHQFPEDDFELKPHMEIALIPPVSGG